MAGKVSRPNQWGKPYAFEAFPAIYLVRYNAAAVPGQFPVTTKVTHDLGKEGEPSYRPEDRRRLRRTCLTRQPLLSTPAATDRYAAKIHSPFERICLATRCSGASQGGSTP